MRNRTLAVLFLLIIVVPVWVRLATMRVLACCYLQVYFGAVRVANKQHSYSDFHQDKLNYNELLFPVFLVAVAWRGAVNVSPDWLHMGLPVVIVHPLRRQGHPGRLLGGL